MKATLAKAEGFERTLEIVVEPEQVKQSYDRVVGRHARDIAIPGFRKGKAPRTLTERALRPDFIQQHVLEDVGLPAYHQAVKEHSLAPISQPRVEWVQFDKHKEMVFRATFDVRPEIAAPEYKGLTVKVPQTEVDETDVDRVIESERQKRTTLASVEEDRGLELNDWANVNFNSYEGGEPVPQGSQENLVVEINDEFVLPGFCQHLLGMKKDEIRRFQDSFPPSFKNEALAGKTLEFEFKLLDIKKRVLPDLSDEFARQVSRYSTLDEMRTEVRRQLEIELHSGIGNQIIDQILPNLEVRLPQSLLVQTGQEILGEWNKQLESMGSDLNTFLRNQRWTQERLSAELLPRAQRVSLAELVVEAVARQEDITVSDDDVEGEINRFARMSNQDATAVRDGLEGDDALPQLRKNILRRRVLEHLYQNATVEKAEPPPPAEVEPIAAADEATPAAPMAETAAEAPAETQPQEA